jgi:hypothetical protein
MMIPLEAQQEFELVLRNERLADRSQFSKQHIFEELPLYSRYDQIRFLSQFGDLDALLLELALNYLKEVADNHAPEATWLGAVTIWEDDSEDGDPIVPMIFICNGDVKQRLKDLDLQPALGKFASFVKAALRSIGKQDQMVVMQDDDTVEGSVRYFISYNVPPQGMMSLSEFHAEHPRRRS